MRTLLKLAWWFPVVSGVQSRAGLSLLIPGEVLWEKRMLADVEEALPIDIRSGGLRVAAHNLGGPLGGFAPFQNPYLALWRIK